MSIDCTDISPIVSFICVSSRRASVWRRIAISDVLSSRMKSSLQVHRRMTPCGRMPNISKNFWTLSINLGKLDRLSFRWSRSVESGTKGRQRRNSRVWSDHAAETMNLGDFVRAMRSKHWCYELETDNN